eukprot:gnl/TRDRNA2_/TRDRNA2_33541_c0_seq1.p1 gnl/TRDRNA2_/TRDRNA2_33541_c0~~gnl/TRDRNA2_/TRDRNA2_33541_c0_seq1.p1  ORF type:complete len:187 (+),score=34.71 gnl/TRDRNA2_/TRDRNA2_33541_c0_seq1:148-708(+)
MQVLSHSETTLSQQEYEVLDGAVCMAECRLLSAAIGLPLERVSCVTPTKVQCSRSASKPCDSMQAIISVAWAVSLQKELLDGFRDPDFQAALLGLLREWGGPDASGHLHGRRELCLEVQQRVLPKYGFEGTREGVRDMIQTLEAMMEYSEELREGAVQIADALGLAPPVKCAATPTTWACGLPWSV